MTSVRLTRVLPLALAACAALATPASANHSPCEAAGGLTITGIGPTRANVCVLVAAGSTVMVGVDAIHQCASPATCTVAGARAELIAGNPEVCSAIVVNGFWVFDGCLL